MERNQFDVVVYGNTNFVRQLVRKENIQYNNGGNIVSVTENFYDDNNYQLDEVRQYTSNGIKSTKFKYPHDFPENFVCRPMLERNIVYPILQMDDFVENKIVKTTENGYWWYNNDIWIIAPSNIKIGYGGSLDTKITYDKYDYWGNLLQYHTKENVNTILYRGYNNEYVTATIVGKKSYAEVNSLMGAYLDQLDDNLTKFQLENLNKTIRTLCPDSQITTYTYKPLNGISSKTTPNGQTTFYEYDGFRRLNAIKDQKGNNLQQVDYNYMKD